MGEPVPRLPPMVAPLRISRRGELREQLREQRDAAVEPALDLGEGQRRTDLDPSSPTAKPRSSGEPVDRDDERGARRRACSPRRPSRCSRRRRTASGCSREQAERLGEVAGRTNAPVRRRRVAAGAAAGRRAALRQRVVRRRASRGRTRHRGSGGSRCSGTGCRSARAGRSRWAVLAVASAGRGAVRGPGGSTPRPCCRRTRACSSRTASRRAPPSRPAPGAGRPGCRGPRR